MSSKASNKEAAGTAAPPIAPEDPAAYDEGRPWREAPWGDTHWCEMCSTCMRWRLSQRARGRVCVTSFNFNFPLVIIEDGRCNEYRPVPGAEHLWAEEYPEEDDDYEGRRRDREGSGNGEATYDDEGGARRAGSRRRPRRRPRRGGGGSGGGAAQPSQT